MLGSNKLLILVPIEQNSSVFPPKSGIVAFDKGSYLHVCYEGNLTNNPKLKSYIAKIKKASEQLKKDLPGPETGFYRKSEFHIVAEYDLRKSYVLHSFSRKISRLEDWCQAPVDSILGPVYKKDSMPDRESFLKDLETFSYVKLNAKEFDQQHYLTHMNQTVVCGEEANTVELLEV